MSLTIILDGYKNKRNIQYAVILWLMSVFMYTNNKIKLRDILYWLKVTFKNEKVNLETWYFVDILNMP